MIFIDDILKIKTFGGAHEKESGVVISGFPSGIDIDRAAVQAMLDRRRPGTGRLVSQRQEDDIPVITGGIKDCRTTGKAIRAVFENKDLKDAEGDDDFIPRPGHGDYTHYMNTGSFVKGASSARYTVGVVFAGALCSILLETKGIRISSELLFPSEEQIDRIRIEGDSIGGLVSVRVQGLKTGFGAPEGGKLESIISACIFNIPGVRALSFGTGSKAAFMKGSEFNDAFGKDKDGKIITLSNRSGGVAGGLATGADLELEVSFRPTPTIHKEQQSVDLKSGELVSFRSDKRYDPCIALRGRVALEAAVAVALADVILKNG